MKWGDGEMNMNEEWAFNTSLFFVAKPLDIIQNEHCIYGTFNVQDFWIVYFLPHCFGFLFSGEIVFSCDEQLK